MSSSRKYMLFMLAAAGKATEVAAQWHPSPTPKPSCTQDMTSTGGHVSEPCSKAVCGTECVIGVVVGVAAVLAGFGLFVKCCTTRPAPAVPPPAVVVPPAPLHISTSQVYESGNQEGDSEGHESEADVEQGNQPNVLEGNRKPDTDSDTSSVTSYMSLSSH